MVRVTTCRTERRCEPSNVSVAFMDSAGKLISESILETKAATILQFPDGANPLLRSRLCGI